MAYGPKDDEEFSQRGRTKPVHQNRQFFASFHGELSQNPLHYFSRDFIGRFQRPALDSGLPMDAHANLHLLLPQLEDRPAGSRDDARTQRHTHGPRAVNGLLRRRTDFREPRAFFRAGSRRLNHQQVAGDSAPILASFRRSRGDVIVDPDRLDSDVFRFQHLGGNIEVEHVAGVVAVDKQHALTAMGGLSSLEYGRGRRRSKNVAGDTGVGHAPPHKSREHGLMPASSPRDNRDLAGHRGVSADDRPQAGKLAYVLGEGEGQSFNRLQGYIVRVVDQFLHLAMRHASENQAMKRAAALSVAFAAAGPSRPSPVGWEQSSPIPGQEAAARFPLLQR